MRGSEGGAQPSRDREPGGDADGSLTDHTGGRATTGTAYVSLT